MKCFVVVLVLCSAACAPDAQSPPAAAPIAPAERACPAVAFPDGLPGSGVVLFGEIHGTREGPALVSAVLCRAARSRPTTLALEVPIEMQGRLDGYLASNGDADAQRALLDDLFWREALQDGRRSKAILSLIDDARQLRREGRAVAVLAIDPGFQGDANDRDRGMAERLLAHLRGHPGNLIIAVAGNVHTRAAPGYPWAPEDPYEPLGYRLRQAGASLLAFNMRSGGGSAWICSGPTADTCGPTPVGGSADGSELGVYLFDATAELTGADVGHDGMFYVGNVSASSPAVEAEPRSGRGAHED